MAMLVLTDIHKSYRIGPTEVAVLKGVSFTIQAGEMVSIMGSSGSGKSTLMNILGVLDRPSSGSYRLDNVDVLAARADTLAGLRNRKIGFVFQQYHLLPRLTAIENVCLPLRYRGVPARQMREQAMAVLQKVGVAERAEHRPSELSGGQCQRVAIARALVGDPAVILADEPTGALDTRVGAEIMALFQRFNREDGMTVVIITHDPSIAQRCRRRLVLQDGVLIADSGVFEKAA
jgi:putative ABC transport system ATP-binding protein